jgi:hypothetical protein
MEFGKRSTREFPVMFIRIDTLVTCRKGVQKRLRKEMNLLYAAAPEEREYISKRKANIHRLRAIRDELKKLEKQL